MIDVDWLSIQEGGRNLHTSFFPVWKLFPFSPRSTYHNDIASITSAASTVYSVWIVEFRFFADAVWNKWKWSGSSLFPLSCFLVLSPFFSSPRHMYTKVVESLQCERWVANKSYRGEVKVEKRKNPSTHDLKAHICQRLHSWPQTFHVL